MHPVETDLEVSDAGALTFPRFQFHQILIGVFAQIAQLVEFGIVASGDHSAIAQSLWRIGDDRPTQQIADFGMSGGAEGEILQQGRGQQAEKLLYAGQPGQRVGQGDQITRARRFQRDSRQNPFYITRAAQ